MVNRIHSRPIFQRLLFSTSFEDPELDRRALGIGPHHTVLCVTSGGCNVLALLLDEPAKLIAFDMNPVQNALLQLKIEGLRRLDYDEYLELLGVCPSTRRLKLYRQLPSIPFFDTYPRMIDAGVLTQGRFERYLAGFRRFLRFLQGGWRIEALMEPRELKARERFYEEIWNTPQWRTFFRLFFSRLVLGQFGLDPKFFEHVEGANSFGELFLRRTRRALVELPVHENYFVAFILFGTYRSALPPYLERKNFLRLRRLVDRVEIVTEEAERFFSRLPNESVDRINFSNIFEWIAPAACERLLSEMVRACRPGARMTYRNLLVHRERPASLADFIHPNPLAKKLLPLDRAFVYSNFVVEEIVKEATCRSSIMPLSSSMCSR